MAYEKNIWTDGDIITAEKLNNMEDGIANGGSGVIANWNQRSPLSPSFIKNRPFYENIQFTGVYIINTEPNKIIFTYNNTDHVYEGTFTTSVVDGTDYSGLELGIIIYEGVDTYGEYNIIDADYEMKYIADENSFYSMFNDFYGNIFVDRITSSSDTQYNISFSSQNIGDTIEAYVQFGQIGQHDIRPLEYKYFDYLTVKIGRRNNSYGIDPFYTENFNNIYFVSLDQFSDYLDLGYRNISLLNVDTGRMYRMIEKSSSSLYIFMDFEGNVFEYNSSYKEFTYYPHCATITRENNTDVCDTPFDELKYAKYITDHETGIKMYKDYWDNLNDGASFIGDPQFDTSNSQIIYVSCHIAINGTVTMTRKEYSLTEVTT